MSLSPVCLLADDRCGLAPPNPPLIGLGILQVAENPIALKTPSRLTGQHYQPCFVMVVAVLCIVFVLLLLCGSQGFLHTRKPLHHWSYIPSPSYFWRQDLSMELTMQTLLALTKIYPPLPPEY